MTRPLLAVASACALSFPSAAQCLDWSSSYTPAGTYAQDLTSGWVRDVLEFDDGTGSALYLAGEFDHAGPVFSQSVVRYRNGAYEPLGSGIFFYCWALRSLDLGSGPELHVIVSNGARLQRWSGTDWIEIPGVTFNINDVEVFDFGQGRELVIATAEPQQGSYVLHQTSSGWVPLGSGPTQLVYDLTVYDDGTGPALYANGILGATAAGGSPLRGLARWNGAGWVEVGGGLHNGQGIAGYVTDATVWNDGTGDKLVVVGNFQSAGNQTAPGIAQWDGTSWTAVGGSTGDLFVVDRVQLAGGDALAVTGTNGGATVRASLWDGTTWTELGGAFDPQTIVSAYATYDDGTGPRVHVGGRFQVAGGVPASNVAGWDGTWHPVGDPRSVSGTIQTWAQHDDGSGPALFAGGTFRTAGGAVVRDVARFDGSTWTAVGATSGPSKSVRALLSADVGAGSRLYAAGNFTQIGGVAANRIAAWDGSTWSPLGSGIGTGEVNALLVHDDGNGPALYAAGNFASAGGQPASSVARWNASSGWSRLGTTLNNELVNALAVFDDGTGPRLYAGGTFSLRVASWNGSAWIGVPQPPTNGGGTVTSLASYRLGSVPALFVGGRYASVGGVSTNGIAAWDGTAWHTFGGGVSGLADSRVTSLRVLDDGTGPGARLHVAGRFATIDGTPAASVAAWDGSAWQSAGGGGVAGFVSALGVFDDGEGPAVYVGGAFSYSSSGPTLNLARYGRHGLAGCEPTTGASVCDGSGSGAACPCGNVGLVGRGCGNSADSSGARLRARGAANVSDDTVTLELSGTTPSAAVLYFQGTSAIASGAGSVFGDGLRCAGGTQRRLGVRQSVAGASSFGAAAGTALVTDAGAVTGAATRYYQAWYRDPNPGFCTSALFNLSNAVRIEWAG